MLTNLIVTNFALIKDLEIEFDKNLNVLSGETGSGKSLLMRALKFVLGDRADKTNIRNGESYLKVQCVFDSSNTKLKSILDDIGIDIEDEEPIIISRSLTLEGKSDIRINGNLTTLSNLNKLTKNLADFYGQQEHFSLLENSKQLEVVDNYFKDEISKIKQSLHNHLIFKNEIINKLNTNFGDDESKENKIELLEYQIKEISENTFTDDYEQQLKDKKLKFQSIEKIKEVFENAITILNKGYNNASISNAIKESSNSFKSILKYDDTIDTIIEKSDNIRYELEDLEAIIMDKYNNELVDEINIDDLEYELDKIKLLKSKYGNTFEDRNIYLTKCKNELNFIKNNDKIVSELKSQLEKINILLIEDCENLYNLRKKSIKEIEQNISKNFKDLEMKNATFKIQHSFKNEIDAITNNGYDNIEFLFSTNLGQPLKPLSKIISGGELSRFMLAYKNVIMQKDGIELLILDEIDSGISGVVAEKVAYKLSDLSKSTQIVSISHLPQIVSIADRNLKVFKETIDNETFTRIDTLKNDSLYAEIARLSGSKELKELDIKYAEELKSTFNNYKMQKLKK